MEEQLKELTTKIDALTAQVAFLTAEAEHQLAERGRAPAGPQLDLDLVEAGPPLAGLDPPAVERDLGDVGPLQVDIPGHATVVELEERPERSSADQLGDTVLEIIKSADRPLFLSQ